MKSFLVRIEIEWEIEAETEQRAEEKFWYRFDEIELCDFMEIEEVKA